MTGQTEFIPSRTEALKNLSDFLPKAGRNYAAHRNYDFGAGRHHEVSKLSPYLRCRLITEREVLRAVLNRHSEKAAEKFIQEVFWRTYWKGWLELRPSTWRHYQTGLAAAWNNVQTQDGLRDRWGAACRGETDLECFNSWAHELVSTGYLHNHARMWFASIWIFTLRLPWELGADFFLRHLLDGDPASNTLSWRWVAGLQTPGKTYLARASNIAKYSDGRFRAERQLADVAPPLTGPPHPQPTPLRPPLTVQRDLKTGLLLHHDDLSPGFLLEALQPVSLCQLQHDNGLSPLTPSPLATGFRHAATNETATRFAHRFETTAVASSVEDLLNWSARENLQQIITAEAPVGPIATLLQDFANHPQAPRLCAVRRPYDALTWPLATKGFFNFRKSIPNVLSQII
ncbi:FAD-binding domain-containing protein [Roseobacter sp. EG26]|uniref:FAD-binding domain-containing protein n=1 Tax=Roseobacter sp. EG26 TaxID=3412477 RepID=UPI003CE56953